MNAKDNEKAELLKDILAFTNAWRELDAHILIGVKEIKGGKSLIKGISDNLDDAQLQQFICSKVNKPIKFSYQTTEMEGKKVGLIIIPIQSRPVYLKKDFANLKANTVYVKRGSSTSIALPDEIASMGSSDNGEVKKSSKLKVFIVSGKNDERQLDSIDESVILAKIPGKDEFPKYGVPYISRVGVSASTLAAVSAFVAATSPLVNNYKNKEYYSEFAEYFRKIKLLFALKIGMKNDGNLVARDVRAVVDFQGLPEGSDILRKDELPEFPESETSHASIKNFRSLITQGVRESRDILHEHKALKPLESKLEGYPVKFDFGFRKLQSGDSRTHSEPLYLKITDSCQISANVTIFSDDLENPIKLNFPINVSVEKRDYSVDEIINEAENAIK